MRAQTVPEELPGDIDLTAELAEVSAALFRAGVAAAAVAELSMQQLVDSALIALRLPPELKLELFSELRVEARLRRLIENLPGPRRPRLDFGPDDPRLN